MALCRSFVIAVCRKTSVLLYLQSRLQADRALFHYDSYLSKLRHRASYFTKLAAKTIRSGYYVINPLDLVELSLPLRADATPKEKRLSYDELFDKYIEVRFDLQDLQHRLGHAEAAIERLSRRIAELSKPGGQRKTTT